MTAFMQVTTQSLDLPVKQPFSDSVSQSAKLLVNQSKVNQSVRF